VGIGPKHEALRSSPRVIPRKGRIVCFISLKKKNRSSRVLIRLIALSRAVLCLKSFSLLKPTGLEGGESSLAGQNATPSSYDQWELSVINDKTRRPLCQEQIGSGETSKRVYRIWGKPGVAIDKKV